MEERTIDLQRQLMLAQSELKAVKEDAQIQDLDKARLQTQLAGVVCRGLFMDCRHVSFLFRLASISLLACPL